MRREIHRGSTWENLRERDHLEDLEATMEDNIKTDVQKTGAGVN
jgi:hypothetical protein